MPRLLLIATALAVLAAACVSGADVVPADPGAPGTTFAPVTTLPGVSTSDPETGATTTAPSSTTTVPQRPEGVVPPESVGEPWGEVVGLTMFRGNPTRTYFGSGPVPTTAPEQLWRFPDKQMCGQSPVGKEPKVWCGSGWTGQPVVWERPDGITEVIFGAYDKAIHFVNADTGERTRPDFDMGDIIKGSVTLDPDGYPLLYTGSRDPRFRIIALDADEPYEVWSLHAKSVEGMWNDDWDSNPVIIDDMMYEGGENSWWFAVKLNRGYDADGKVTVDPQVVYEIPAWTEELQEIFGRQHSVENSTAVFEQRAYFTTSAGRVVGVDLTDIENGNGEIFLARGRRRRSTSTPGFSSSPRTPAICSPSTPKPATSSGRTSSAATPGPRPSSSTRLSWSASIASRTTRASGPTICRRPGPHGRCGTRWSAPERVWNPRLQSGTAACMWDLATDSSTLLGADVIT